MRQRLISRASHRSTEKNLPKAAPSPPDPAQSAQCRQPSPPVLRIFPPQGRAQLGQALGDRTYAECPQPAGRCGPYCITEGRILGRAQCLKSLMLPAPEKSDVTACRVRSRRPGGVSTQVGCTPAGRCRLILVSQKAGISRHANHSMPGKSGTAACCIQGAAVDRGRAAPMPWALLASGPPFSCPAAVIGAFFIYLLYTEEGRARAGEAGHGGRDQGSAKSFGLFSYFALRAASGEILVPALAESQLSRALFCCQDFSSLSWDAAI